jgi:hypothetical protein
MQSTIMYLASKIKQENVGKHIYRNAFYIQWNPLKANSDIEYTRLLETLSQGLDFSLSLSNIKILV